MKPIEVLLLFKDIFHIENEIEEWFPNGLNSVRVRFCKDAKLPFKVAQTDFIFAIRDEGYWSFETVEAFIKRRESYNEGYTDGRNDAFDEIRAVLRKHGYEI